MKTVFLEKKRGFTLIELVIVIVLLGILAATALPKFSDLTRQARKAANQGFAGALGAAVSIAHATWIASGQTSSGTVNLEGNQIQVNDKGWPGGAIGASQPASNSACKKLIGQIINNPPLIRDSSCSGTSGACYLATVSNQVCTYQLYNGGTPVTGFNVRYNAKNGQVTAVPQ